MSDPLVLLECYAIAAVPAVLLLIYAQSRYNRRREDDKRGQNTVTRPLAKRRW
jgi:hypothetical protein